jgi:NRPS condensation-like uncharacterized protein
MMAQPFDWMQHIYGEVQEPLIRFALELDGRLDIDTLRDSVDLIAQAVPVAAARYDEQTCDWKSSATARANMVHLVEVGPEEREHTRHIALLAHLNPSKGPQLRITLIRTDDMPDLLVVVINHMLADGQAAKQLLCLISSTYARMAGAGSYERGIAPTVPASRSMLQLIANLDPRRLAVLMMKRTRLPKVDTKLHLPLAQGISCPRYVTRAIAVDDVRMALERTHAIGSTFNDLLLAAYGRTICSAAGIESVVLPCPVDLRRFARAGQTCGICNLTGSYVCRIPSFKQASLGQALMRVTHQMRLQKTSDECLRGPLLFNAAALALPYEGARNLYLDNAGIPKVSYTNLGATEAEQLSFGDVHVTDMLFLAATRAWPCFQLSVSTFDGICTLSATMNASDAAEDLARQVLNVTAEQIELFARQGV